MTAADGGVLRDWRLAAGTPFDCEKRPATGTRGMVAASHPLASAAGVEMLAAGGNAVDAAVASLFALTVVEPMMVSIFGGGIAHLRLADGRHTVIDGLGRAPLAAAADVYRPVSDAMPDYLETEGRENAIGPKSVAAPGSLMAWCELVERFGRLPLGHVMEPAIRYARRGYRLTAYVSECIDEALPGLALDPAISERYLRGGRPVPAGTHLVMPDYARTLEAIAADGPGVLYGGPLGQRIADYFAEAGGLITVEDLTQYRTIEREVVRGSYRGREIVGPPPPASGGVHVIQMLNLLEGFDVAGMGFGTAQSLHLILESLKIAFADRKAATADPDFVDVPAGKLLSKEYAGERRPEIDVARAGSYDARVVLPDAPDTTHVTVADADGNVIAATQTINATFGARVLIPDTGIVPNNYMHVFDPHPGNALSIAPGKRVTTSMSPVMVVEDGHPTLALGLPGGLRIFGVAMQALVNRIDHGMSLQEMVEAPRLWTQGHGGEIEDDFPEPVRAALARMGHELTVVPHVGGGMNAVAIEPDGTMTGASCWRADGMPVGISGGHAREGARFWPDQHGR